MEKLSLLTKIEIPVIVGKVDIESMDFSTRPIKAARLVKRKAIGKNTRDAIFKRDEYACLRCGCKEDLTIDHIIPLSLGGLNKVGNFQTLCNPCNNEKGSFIVDYRPIEFLSPTWFDLDTPLSQVGHDYGVKVSPIKIVKHGKQKAVIKPKPKIRNEKIDAFLKSAGAVEMKCYEVEMFKDGKWVSEKRYYRGKKSLSDFDLHDVEGLRRNAKMWVKPSFKNGYNLENIESPTAKSILEYQLYLQYQTPEQFQLAKKFGWKFAKYLTQPTQNFHYE